MHSSGAPHHQSRVAIHSRLVDRNGCIGMGDEDMVAGREVPPRQFPVASEEKYHQRNGEDVLDLLDGDVKQDRVPFVKLAEVLVCVLTEVYVPRTRSFQRVKVSGEFRVCH